MPPENTLAWLQYSLKLAFYYRATLCVSAVFAVARCLSVPIRHVLAFYPHGWRYCQTSFSARYGSPIILVFDPQCRYPIPRGPFSGGGRKIFCAPAEGVPMELDTGTGDPKKLEWWGWGKIFRFSTERERYEIGLWLLWNECEVICTLSNGDIINDLDVPITRFSRSWHIWSRISQKQCVLGTELL